MCVVMIEPDIVVDKRGPLVFWVLFNRIEHNWVLKDRGIEVVGPVQREAIKTNWDDDGNDEGLVQEGFRQQPKWEGFIYPGNNPEQIMPYFKKCCRHNEACCSEEKTTAVERSKLSAGV